MPPLYILHTPCMSLRRGESDPPDLERDCVAKMKLHFPYFLELGRSGDLSLYILTLCVYFEITIASSFHVLREVLVNKATPIRLRPYLPLAVTLNSSSDICTSNPSISIHVDLFHDLFQMEVTYVYS